MFTTSIKGLMLGSKIAATATLLATMAMAQTTAIETPQGNTVVVPEEALTEQSSVGVILENEYPLLESIENNEAIAETLIAQGYSNVVISREGPILTVTAQRGGVPIELVYSTANGRLVSVDGVETRPEGEGSSANDQTQATGTSSAVGGDDGTSDDESGDEGSTTDRDSDGGDTSTDGGDGAGDEGAGGGAGGDGSEGSEGSDGSDGSGGSDGSDGGGESSDGSDSNG
ncbi:hypothetical protein [Paracoccus sp. (in: a-proteobacteria)]|uniref:hypothetical protein n=1 Tax=Paracoccus sp. TaxID=267 RepID=UPI00396C3F29